MYFCSYDESESLQSLSNVSSDKEIDLYEDQDQDNLQIYNYNSHSASSIDNSKEDEEKEEESVLDQTRIYNIAEVKVFLDEITCPICSHVIIGPKICEECGQCFCTICIEKWFKKSTNQQCPCCRKNQHYKISSYFNQGIMDGKVPKVLQKLLSKLLLTCRYNKHGCEEIITYDFREKHENNYCQYQEKDCPNYGCYETMFRKDLEDHYLECKYGIVQCKYCQYDFLRMDIELHLEECNCRPILCEWCQQNYQAIDIDQHLQECEFQDIICEYCSKKYKKQDMKHHTPVFCLKNLYDNSLNIIQQNAKTILQLQKQFDLLNSKKQMEQQDLNYVNTEVLTQKQNLDIDEELQKVNEQNIQIEQNIQDQQLQIDEEYNNSLSKSQEIQQKQFGNDNKSDFECTYEIENYYYPW